MSVPGDPELTVGSVIEFLVPDMRYDENGGRFWDVYYAGNFLVTAVRHKIDQENKFITIMEISKESLPIPYEKFNNDLPSWTFLRGK